MEAVRTVAAAANWDPPNRGVEARSRIRSRTTVVAGIDNRAFRKVAPACSSPHPVEGHTDGVDTRREVVDRNRPPRHHPVYPDRFPGEVVDNNKLVRIRPWEVAAADDASDADCQSAEVAAVDYHADPAELQVGVPRVVVAHVADVLMIILRGRLRYESQGMITTLQPRTTIIIIIAVINGCITQLQWHCRFVQLNRFQFGTTIAYPKRGFDRRLERDKFEHHHRGGIAILFFLFGSSSCGGSGSVRTVTAGHHDDDDEGCWLATTVLYYYYLFGRCCAADDEMGIWMLLLYR